MIDTMARPPETARDNDLLFRDEHFWRDHYNFLRERGYLLRPRYQPDWRPSWKGTKKDPDECEDGQSPLYTTIIDARRLTDDRIVAIKRLTKSQHPLEVQIVQQFSQSTVADDPRNHSVPVFEVLESPYDKDILLLVMSYLTPYETVPFGAIGEVVEFFRQLLEGLLFIHENHIAHRDIMASNVMMEPSVYSETPHPIVRSKSYDFKRKVKCVTRTERPTKYYYTDFGISCRVPKNVKDPREPLILGGDRTVPEHQRPTGPQNPCRTDVYCLGNLFRTQFLQKYTGLDFLAPLVTLMVQEEPSARPTIAEAFTHFNGLLQAVPSGRLRARLVPRGENAIVGLFRSCQHAIRTAGYVLAGKPALPTPGPVPSMQSTKQRPRAPTVKPAAPDAPRIATAPGTPTAKSSGSGKAIEVAKASKAGKATKLPKSSKDSKPPKATQSPKQSKPPKAPVGARAGSSKGL